MKKIFLILIMIGIYSICQAKVWQDYGLYTTPADGDHLMINDVSDLTDDTAGTLKRLAWLYVQPRDSDLTSIAALNTSAAGRNLLTLAQMSNGQLIIGNGTSTPALATITETGDALTISNGPGTITFSTHANLEAIADGEDGVVDPCASFYDSDAAGQSGSDLLVGQICGGWRSGLEAAQVSDLKFRAHLGSNTPTEVGEFDGVQEQWNFNYPVTAPSVDAGVQLVTVSTETYSLADGQEHADTCYLRIYVTDSGTVQTITLNDDPTCNATGGGKYICVMDRHVDEEVRIDPHVNDYIIGPDGVGITATVKTFTQGLYIENATTPALGDYICFVGLSAGYWVVWDFRGDWNEQN